MFLIKRIYLLQKHHKYQVFTKKSSQNYIITAATKFDKRGVY